LHNVENGECFKPQRFTKIDAKNHKQKIGNNTIWVGLLLGLLLIIPCSVQNILQNDFSVKQQKTLNRSKSTIQTNSNCCV
jgi:hypothetical protein